MIECSGSIYQKLSDALQLDKKLNDCQHHIIADRIYRAIGCDREGSDLKSATHETEGSKRLRTDCDRQKR